MKPLLFDFPHMFTLEKYYFAYHIRGFQKLQNSLTVLYFFFPLCKKMFRVSKQSNFYRFGQTLNETFEHYPLLKFQKSIFIGTLVNFIPSVHSSRNISMLKMREMPKCLTPTRSTHCLAMKS